MRLLPVTVTAALLTGTLLTGAPAHAHGDQDRITRQRTLLSADQNISLISSGNVALASSNPSSAGISGCFLKTKPLFVQSNLDSVRVYDVSAPTRPTLTGVLPSLQFDNEAMNCGERKYPNGTVSRFALVGIDLYQASPGDIEHTNVGGGELMVVDVTDPANPRIAGRAPGTTSTHTLSCVVQTDCTYAYSAGDDSTGRFSVFDLRNLDHPVEVDSDPTTAGVQGFASPTAGHKWNFDDAGFGTHTGFDGASMWDARNPRAPKLVTTTGLAGQGDDPRFPGWNDFILHNSQRPNAKAFRNGAAPSLANGNILLVTEEDYEQTDCSKAGSFQTWWVKRLDGTKGAIVPLDKVELADLGTYPVPVGAFCSSHWFDFHPSGIVTAGFYGGGTQFLDVRNPKDIKPYGHATWGVSEVWDSYWMPVYTKAGVMTSKKTNLAYSVDLARGIDVYRVDLPGTAWDTNMASVAPTAGSWTTGGSLVGILSALVVAVLVRRRTATRAAVAA
ncbi:MAG: hypothetical protein JWR85_693 [Marmoricola sp.]|nr:hypothetical protein [Marmoricola sp.]